MQVLMTECDITPAQKRKWIETRSAMLWKAPAFTHILFSMLNPSKGELVAHFTTTVAIAATDGSNLILNPMTFFEMSLDERVFVVAHEILHCVLNHCILGFQFRRQGMVKYSDGLALTYEHPVMNAAMDYVINDLLVTDNIGKMPVYRADDPEKGVKKGDQMGLRDVNIGTLKDNFMDVYRRIYEQQKKRGKKPCRDGQPGGPGQPDQGQATQPGNQPSTMGEGLGQGFDEHLAPGAVAGQDPQQAASERSGTEWATAVAAAIATAKSQGKLPAGMARMFQEIVDPQVSWQEHLRAAFMRRMGGGGYDWRKADKQLILRDIYAPRRSGNGCGTIVIGGDTSGSMGQREFDVMFGEIRGIMEDARPQRIIVLWCDAKVHKADEPEDESEIDGMKPLGGGGTDFRPVFDWCHDNGVVPDGLVYITDGYGTFPDKEPAYPVIWCDTVNNQNYPWGDVVRVDIKKK